MTKICHTLGTKVCFVTFLQEILVFVLSQSPPIYFIIKCWIYFYKVQSGPKVVKHLALWHFEPDCKGPQYVKFTLEGMHEVWLPYHTCQSLLIDIHCIFHESWRIRRMNTSKCNTIYHFMFKEKMYSYFCIYAFLKVLKVWRFIVDLPQRAIVYTL